MKLGPLSDNLPKLVLALPKYWSPPVVDLPYEGADFVGVLLVAQLHEEEGALKVDDVVRSHCVMDLSSKSAIFLSLIKQL